MSERPLAPHRVATRISSLADPFSAMTPRFNLFFRWFEKRFFGHFDLDDDTVVYPGHAYSNEPSSTIGKQKRTNMYMRFPTLDDFLDAMGYSR